MDLGESSGRYLSLAEREEIAIARGRGDGVRVIARALGRPASTISRELNRNSRVRRPVGYRAVLAQSKADARVRRPKTSGLAAHEPLRAYVQDKLSCEQRWSPEQITRRIVVDFPDDERMRVSHEAIYRALYVQGRGALRRELTACLRTGRALRKPRRRVEARGKRQIPAHHP
jgi:IS30 family transposase